MAHVERALRHLIKLVTARFDVAKKWPNLFSWVVAKSALKWLRQKVIDSGNDCVGARAGVLG